MKICYIILTCELFLPTRAQWQNSTFLQKVDKKDVYFISCKMSGENVYGWDTPDDYHSCPLKYMLFIRNMNITDYDWYVFIDDDTYMNTPNLNLFLDNYDSSQLFYIGSKRFDQWNVKYMSGGAGFCLSKPLYAKLADYVRSKSEYSELYFNYNGDVTLGSWVSNIPDVIHVDDDKFSASKHNNDEQLNGFISFHYLKTKEEFDFYYNVESSQKLIRKSPK